MFNFINWLKKNRNGHRDYRYQIITRNGTEIILTTSQILSDNSWYEDIARIKPVENGYSVILENICHDLLEDDEKKITSNVITSEIDKYKEVKEIYQLALPYNYFITSEELSHDKQYKNYIELLEQIEDRFNSAPIIHDEDKDEFAKEILKVYIEFFMNKVYQIGHYIYHIGKSDVMFKRNGSGFDVLAYHYEDKTYYKIRVSYKSSSDWERRLFIVLVYLWSKTFPFEINRFLNKIQKISRKKIIRDIALLLTLQERDRVNVKRWGKYYALTIIAAFLKNKRETYQNGSLNHYYTSCGLLEKRDFPFCTFVDELPIPGNPELDNLRQYYLLIMALDIMCPSDISRFNWRAKYWKMIHNFSDKK